MTLEPHIVARESLTQEIREAMFVLHSRNFECVDRERFIADLEEKDWVILLLNGEGGVAGFSTQKLISLPVAGRTVRFLYSGDTVVDRAHWNTPLLAGCFGHLMLRLLDTYGEGDLFWFLISKGFRTYRFLPVFFNRFWPAPDSEMPADMAALLTVVARHKFNDAFDSCSGIIRPLNGDRLIPELAGISTERLKNPQVAFFLARNPGYAHGDELACLAPISRDNLNAYAHRVIRDTTPVWSC